MKNLVAAIRAIDNLINIILLTLIALVGLGLAGAGMVCTAWLFCEFWKTTPYVAKYPFPPIPEDYWLVVYAAGVLFAGAIVLLIVHWFYHKLTAWAGVCLFAIPVSTEPATPTAVFPAAPSAEELQRERLLQMVASANQQRLPGDY